MKHDDYWRDRFEKLASSQLEKGLEYYGNLEKEYRKAEQSIEKDIVVWYQRIAQNNNVTFAEAKRLLNTKELKEFRWTVDDYIKYGKENTVNKKWIKELENASARVHINRLEAIKIQIQQHAEILYGNQLDGLDRTIRQIYSDSYYKTAFEIQRGFNIGQSLQSLDEQRIGAVLSKPWTSDGKNFSDHIWQDKNKLINNLYTELAQATIRGDPLRKVINKFSEKMNSAKSVAGRLIMTESAFFASASQKDCFNDLEVKKYEIVATLDLKTSKVCQDLDGEIFKTSDYKPGITAPPFHCWCRSCVAPYFEKGQTERAARDESGKTYYVPSDMKYPEWRELFIKDVPKNDLKTDETSDIIRTSKDCKNFKEFQTHIFDKYGANVEKTLEVLDLRAILESAAGVEKVLDDFPVARKSFAGFKSKPNGIMSCSLNGEIAYNPKYYKNYDIVEKASSPLGGFHPKNTTIMDNGIHECGHILESILIKNNPTYGNDFQRITAWNQCKEASKIVAEACELAKKTAEGKELLNKTLKQDISGYALQDDSECLAEAMSDYYCNGEKASVLSIMIYKILKERLG